MLSPETETLMRDSIDVFLTSQGFRPPSFGQRLLAQSFAGDVIQPAKVAVVTFRELETVSTGIVEAIQNVVEKVEIQPYESLHKDLIEIFNVEFDQCAAALRRFVGDSFKKLSGDRSVSNRFDTEVEKVKKAKHVQLRLIVAGLSKSYGGETERVLHNSKSEAVGIVENAR
jgi:hypothetical protein